MTIKSVYDVEKIREFCDGWHIITIRKVGYLHDVDIIAEVDYIHDDVEATTWSECVAMHKEALAGIREADQLLQNDFAATWHKW